MLDETDNKVLEALRKDGRATVRDVARQINAPITTVHNRLRKLIGEKVIRQFTIEPDYEKLGRGMAAVVFVVVDHDKIGKEKSAIDVFKKKLRSLPEVEKIFALTGEIDWMLLVRVSGVKELDEFLVRKLRGIHGITKTTTQIVLEEG